MTHDNKNEYTCINAITAAMALAVAISFLDVLMLTIRGMASIPDFKAFLEISGASSLLISLVHIAIWMVVLMPMSKRFNLDRFRLSIANAAFIITAYLLYSFHRELELNTFPADLRIGFIVAGICLVSLLAGKVAYSIIGPIIRRQKPVVMLSRFLVRALSVLAVLLICGCCISVAIEQLQPPSVNPLTHNNHKVKRVIMIVVDTLRADSLGCYDNTRGNRTPNIDRLAAQSTVFSNAYVSSAWTLPSMASIFTGLPVAVHMTRERDSILPDEVTTVTEILAEDGYQTCAIVGNAALSRKRRLWRGFGDRYLCSDSGARKLLIGEKLLKTIVPSRRPRGNSTESLTELAKDCVEINRDRDMFLWLHYKDPHFPYTPPEKFLPLGQEPPKRIGKAWEEPLDVFLSGFFDPTLKERNWMRVLYDGEVSHVDEYIGRFLEYLKKLELYEDSLIILTSDHGEEFWEHDGVGHAHSQYNELIHVPLIIKLPGSNDGKIIAKAVSLESLAPTILQQCEITLQDRIFTAKPLDFQRRTGGIKQDKPIISEGQVLYEDRIAVIFDNLKYKYIRKLLTGDEELYDLSTDPGETTNIAHTHKDKVKQANVLLEQHRLSSEEIKQQLQLENGNTEALDRETIERLKSLGYIQ